MNNYLNFIPYSNFNSWDVKYFLKKDNFFNPSIPIVLFGEFLSKAEIKKVSIEDNKTYEILGVRSYGKGAFINREVEGKNLKMRLYQQAKPNHLFWCKVDTKNGAFGIITEELAGGLGSSNMAFAEIDTKKANVYFIQTLFKSKRIQEYLDSFVSGTTNRKYIRPNQLINEIFIPLPSIEEQNRIVASYNSRLRLALKQEEKAKSLEAEIERYLFKVLDIDIDNNVNDKKYSFQLVQYKNVERWAVDYLNKYTKMSFLFKGKYQPVKLKELILSYQYGLSEKADVKNIGVPILRMNNIVNSELDLNNLKYIKKTSNVEKYILNVGDLLFNRTNSKELVGKTAIFLEKDIFTFASYLIRIVINPNLADNFYINYLFNSSILQVQKDMVSRQITGQANINAQEMQDFLFPLPPIEKQKQISNHINSIKAQIKELYLLSFKNKEEAMLEFEKEIFN